MDLHHHIASNCEKNDFPPNITSHHGNIRSLMTNVSAGLGIAIIPNCVQSHGINGCQFIPMPELSLTCNSTYIIAPRLRSMLLILLSFASLKNHINPLHLIVYSLIKKERWGYTEKPFSNAFFVTQIRLHFEINAYI